MNAALDLFAERGFHGTAVPLVAERAGVGAGTIYRYFDTKEALVNAVYQRHKRGLADAVRAALQSPGASRQRFHALWSRMLELAEEQPTAIRFLELHHHAPYLDRKSRLIEDEIMAAAGSFFAEMPPRARAAAVPAELLVAVVWGSFVQVVKKSWEGRLELTPEVVRAAEEACWRAVNC